MSEQAAFAERLLLARTSNPAALKELAEDHLPLVAAMVRRFPRRQADAEELYQQGCVGLMKALNRYDPAFGTTFSTYAAALILGEMRMLCRAEAPVHVPRGDRELRARIRRASKLLTSHLGREPTVDELASLLRMSPAELALAMEEISVCSMDAPVRSGMAPLAELLPAVDAWQDRVFLRDLIARLPTEDRRLLLLRFRLGLTQTETARRLGMTQVQVSRREGAIRQQLREAWRQADT